MPDSRKNWGVSPYVWLSWLIVVLAALGAVLLADPLADPPLGATDLEGQILMGARSQLEPAPLGDWRPDLLVPLKTRIDAWAFEAGGASLVTARRVSAVLAVLVVALCYAPLAGGGRPGTAFLASGLLATNPGFFGIARTSLPAVASLLLMLLTIWVWRAGRRSTALAFAGGSLVVLAGVVENGPRNLFFLFAGGFMFLVLQLHAWRMAWAGDTRRRLNAVLAGAFLVAVGLGYAVVTNWQAYGATWGHFSAGTLHLIAANVVMTPVYVSEMVRLMPITTVIALASFLFFAKELIRPVARHRELDETRLWFLAWLLSGVVYFALIAAPPLDALVLLVPPLCAVAAHGLVRLFAMRSIQRPRLDVMIVMILISVSVWFLAALAVQEWVPIGSWGGVWERHQLRTRFLVILLIWGGGTYLLGWLYLKWKHFTLPLRPLPVTALAVALTVSAVGMGLERAGVWWSGRTHEVEAAQGMLKRLDAGALVAGSWAPLLTLGTPARAAVIWSGLNDRAAEWQAQGTHLLLQEGRGRDAGRRPLEVLEVDLVVCFVN